MITNNTYYKNEIFIPHAQPSVSDKVNASNEINGFIDLYEEEALIKCLGYNLALDLFSNLDSSKTNGLIAGADVKWDHLLNGNEYTVDGKTRKWRGIRYKSMNSDRYDMSFLANYVYYFYEGNNHITRSDIGHQIESGANAETVLPTSKTTKAWRRFVELVQGGYYYGDTTPTIITDGYGNVLSVNYQGAATNMHISLYTFIEEYNKLAEEAGSQIPFEDFTPFVWTNKNQFGI